jgi:hypothetical protein
VGLTSRTQERIHSYKHPGLEIDGCEKKLLIRKNEREEDSLRGIECICPV